MRALASLLAALVLPLAAQAADDGLRTAVLLDRLHGIDANVTYLKASGQELKLDVLLPDDYAARPRPVVLRFHGGGWVAGSRENSALAALPWMQMGFTVVNVSYRLANTALAPAAVEDTLCALQWVGRNAKKYNFDLGKVVTTGNSAGGHLALTTAMIPSDSPFTNQCAANEPTWSGPYQNPAPKVAAVVNWFGITDVADMLQGPNLRSYTVAWFGSMPGRDQLARAISPLTYVRAGGPPVFTVHGDADPLVPYAHGVRLKAALDKAGVKNVLYTIKGGKHGGFPAEQQVAAFEAVREFLRGLDILPAQP
ncbi:alpha/beta hydrolase [Massilia sp. 9I]|uniref:alpha/beta hydrolase n=1 Tax=Massilia sp. 9I TaxID=2653152 RepID=UPI0012F30DE4|nr:alpha/beta hydrolase [Massilia sp. 9I]VXB89676.1 Acetyl esterase/lipase [Massilia sp. 9I]